MIVPSNTAGRHRPTDAAKAARMAKLQMVDRDEHTRKIRGRDICPTGGARLLPGSKKHALRHPPTVRCARWARSVSATH